MTIHRWVATVAEMPSRGAATSRDVLVERAEKLALADLDEPLHIPALCRALAVSERTLRKAFHETYGIPPCRQLRTLRLSQARRALLSADCRFATVTEIAMSFGFAELGRFSVEYRKVFGESPSQTLQRTTRVVFAMPLNCDCQSDFSATGAAIFEPGPILHSDDLSRSIQSMPI